jgi:hypothetical protein
MPRTPKPPPSPRVPDIDRECDECVDRLSDELEHVLLPLAVERRLFDAGTTVQQLAERYLAWGIDVMRSDRPPERITDRKVAALIHLGGLADQIRNYRHIVSVQPDHWTPETRKLYAEGLRMHSQGAEVYLDAVGIGGPTLSEHNSGISRGPRKAPEWTAEKIKDFREGYMHENGSIRGWRKACARASGLSGQAIALRLKGE